MILILGALVITGNEGKYSHYSLAALGLGNVVLTLKEAITTTPPL
jgi:hypothetical protein